MPQYLEIACFNIKSALIAAEAGADRIELCAAMELGGLTPSLNDFIFLRKQIAIPIYVMIRPRGGDFQYTVEEFELMQCSMKMFKDSGCDGFVLGLLNAKKEVDIGRCKVLIDIANKNPCTFHRAIDRAEDIFQATEHLIKLGFQTVLTSGGSQKALQGIATLAELQSKYGKQIHIMPGGGIRAANLATIRQEIQARWYHSSGIIEESFWADAKEVKEMKQLLMSI